MKSWWKKYWPIGVMLLVEIGLWLTNYRQGAFLIGWDNLFPEFNFGLAIKRDLSAIWQEYRGLGLLDGMSHTANLPQDVIRWLLAVFLPTNLVRWVYILGLHFLGGWGMYWLIKNLALKRKQENSQWLAFVGALFYQYNLGIVQTFFLPFEVFIVHYAFLPWLVYALWKYLDGGKRKHLLQFLMFSILSISQAHVPTLFIVYAGVCFLIWITKIFRATSKHLIRKRGWWLLAIAFLVNAFWGLPFAYATVKNSAVISRAKVNQMSTEDIFYRNAKYGDFEDVALLKGFSLDFQHLDYKSGETHLMMWPWLEHFDRVEINILAWAWFGLVILGCWVVIKREKRLMPVVVLFIALFMLMGTDVWGLKLVTQALQKLPLFKQVFRFTFTKFSTAYILIYVLLLCLGLSQLIEWLKGNKFIKVGIVTATVTCLMIYAWPSFQGHFFYENLAVEIPDEYFKLFSYLQAQDNNERLVVLPEPWYWAWTQTNWGTINSGFIWYGIPQSLVDVAFTPWSDKNENLYWQLEQAVYSEDASLLKGVLNKYDVAWILLDGHVDLSPASRMFDEAYEDLLISVPNINLVWSDNELKLYKINRDITLDQFVTIKVDLPTAAPEYEYDNWDQAYVDWGDYVSVDNGEVFYPFRSLFANKTSADQEYEVSENEQQVGFQRTDLPKGEVWRSELDGELWNGVLTERVDNNLKVILDKNEVSEYNSKGDIDVFQNNVNVCEQREGGQIEQQQMFGGVRLISKGSDNCVKIEFPEMSHQFGHLIRIESKSVSQNRGLRVNMFNETLKKSDLDVYLPIGSEKTVSYLLVPPRQKYGLGYTLYINNLSEGNEEVVNELYDVQIYRVPYRFLKQIKLVKGEVKTGSDWLGEFEVKHPNPSYYVVSLNGKGRGTLILSQAFDEGWVAYKGKLFGKKIKDHLLVNNWANGWQIEGDEEKIVLWYWPQALEYVGFLGLVTAIWLVLKDKYPKHHSQEQAEQSIG